MDFSKLGTTEKKSSPIDPIRLFESLPSLENTPNDLWRGQAEALANWHKSRNGSDILVSLNTGAGKTIVGLLMAQSLVNEGVDNVIYVCSTIDLVDQTSLEAKRIGIPCTTRVKGEFSNDLFETGRSFCITTYHALFNGYSSLRRKFFPGAVIFDDAHVAESILRDAFTLRISSKNNPGLFDDVAQLFDPHFQELNIYSRFRDSLSFGQQATAFAAPRGVHERTSQILSIFESHGVPEDANLKYSFSHLKDHISACAAVFTRGVFELSPPFLPSLALDVFDAKIRRVYLSATLQSQTEFVRAFGRLPSDVVMPSNDAGNGERLLIDGRHISDGFTPQYIKDLTREKKVVIAVPNYMVAERWKEVSVPPDSEHFSEELNAFRDAGNGAFVLVSRVDGIDLPHETCRIMVMEGLPSATSLIERFQWEFLRMNNVHATRVANRLAQLFGRINRGRNDYGVFLIEGKDIGIWLGKDRNVSLLPPLLQKQVMLGRSVQEGMSIDSTDKTTEAINSVLDRNETWLNYYEREVKLGELDESQLKRAEIAEPVMVEAALTEAKYSALVWNGDYSEARRIIELGIDKVASVDTPLAGWHAVWLGAAFDLEGDNESANRSYGIARSRLGPSISLPRPTANTKEEKDTSNAFALSLKSYVGFSSGGKCNDEILKLKEELSKIDVGTANQAEAAVRKLGEVLGFHATRPDNDQGTGPDVLWQDEENRILLAFELKTNKEIPATYYKKDIAQGHDHLSWVKQQYPEYGCLGMLFVGPNGSVDPKANPTTEMGLCTKETIHSLQNGVIALIDDLMNLSPIERVPAIRRESVLEKWQLTSLAQQLLTRRINDV